MMRSCLLAGFLLGLLTPLFAAPAAPVRTPADLKTVYRQRAENIVATLGLADPAQADRVRDAIAAQYRDVNQIQDAVAAELQRLKQIKDPPAPATAAQAVRDATEPKLAQLHAAYLARLGADLTPAQIDQVKDGMTYGVLPHTFRAYQEMLPNLTAEQMAQILAWLVEAREHAMDAGSSDAKHAWFGKYKGRINNYLAKAGIDMKRAEKEMQARQKAARSLSDLP